MDVQARRNISRKVILKASGGVRALLDDSGRFRALFSMTPQERLKIEVKLLLSANRKSYMPHRLAQQRMTLSDLEWPFHHPYRALFPR